TALAQPHALHPGRLALGHPRPQLTGDGLRAGVGEALDFSEPPQILGDITLHRGGRPGQARHARRSRHATVRSLPCAVRARNVTLMNVTMSGGCVKGCARPVDNGLWTTSAPR